MLVDLGAFHAVVPPCDTLPHYSMIGSIRQGEIDGNGQKRQKEGRN